MKKLLGILAFAAVACGAAEYVVNFKDMNYDDEQWACSKPGGVLVSKVKGCTATGTYAMPAAGKYIVWVQTETRNEGWRKAQIKINGASFGKFGDEKIPNFNPPSTGYWKKMLMPLEVKAAGEVVKIEIVAISSAARAQRALFTDNPEFDPRKIDGSIMDVADELENAE